MNTGDPPTTAELLGIQRDRLRLRETEAAILRVMAVCDEWDALSKGESATTARIRQALATEQP